MCVIAYDMHLEHECVNRSISDEFVAELNYGHGALSNDHAALTLDGVPFTVEAHGAEVWRQTIDYVARSIDVAVDVGHSAAHLETRAIDNARGQRTHGGQRLRRHAIEGALRGLERRDGPMAH
jgi:hypothetical protein